MKREHAAGNLGVLWCSFPKECFKRTTQSSEVQQAAQIDTAEARVAMDTYLLLFINTVVVSIFGYGLLVAEPSTSPLSRFLTVHIPKKLGKFSRLLFGNRADRLWSYLTEQLNPVFQILYIVLANAMLAVWIIDGYSLLPNRYCGEIHRVRGYICVILILNLYRV